jgi:hypothetical protein
LDKAKEVLYVFMQNPSPSMLIAIFVSDNVPSISAESMDPPEGTFREAYKMAEFFHSEDIGVIEVNGCNLDVSTDFVEWHWWGNQNMTKYNFLFHSKSTCD